MPDALLLMAALLACSTGLVWFALAKEPHWRQVRGPQPLSRRHVWQLRALGTLGLAVSFGVCLAVDHITQAVLVWIMGLAAAALAVAFTLSWRPRLLAPLVVWIPRGGPSAAIYPTAS